MVPATPSTVSGVLKTHFLKFKDNLMYQSAGPLFAWLNKERTLSGLQTEARVIIGPGGSGTADFATAEANSSPHVGVNFTYTRREYNDVISIADSLIRASRNDSDAFYRIVDQETRIKLAQAGRVMGRYLVGSGSGVLGTIDSTTTLSSQVMKFTTTSDIKKLEIGHYLVFAAGATSALRSSTGLKVTKRNKDTGEVTLSGTLDSVGAQLGDSVFIQGTYTAANDMLAPDGLQSILPDSTPSDTFNGVDRSQDPTRLGGQRLDGTPFSRVDGLLELAARIGDAGALPDEYGVFVSYKNYNAINSERASKLELTTMDTAASVKYQGVILPSCLGNLTIYPDFNFDDSRAYIICKSAMALSSLDDLPLIKDLDGQTMLRQQGVDAYAIRFGWYANLICRAPGWCGVVYNFGQQS